MTRSRSYLQSANAFPWCRTDHFEILRNAHGLDIESFSRIFHHGGGIRWRNPQPGVARQRGVNLGQRMSGRRVAAIHQFVVVGVFRAVAETRLNQDPTIEEALYRRVLRCRTVVTASPLSRFSGNGPAYTNRPRFRAVTPPPGTVIKAV